MGRADRVAISRGSQSIEMIVTLLRLYILYLPQSPVIANEAAESGDEYNVIAIHVEQIDHVCSIPCDGHAVDGVDLERFRSKG
jgi:hypothetical protein